MPHVMSDFWNIFIDIHLFLFTFCVVAFPCFLHYKEGTDRSRKKEGSVCHSHFGLPSIPLFLPASFHLVFLLLGISSVMCVLLLSSCSCVYAQHLACLACATLHTRTCLALPCLCDSPHVSAQSPSIPDDGDFPFCILQTDRQCCAHASYTAALAWWCVWRELTTRNTHEMDVQTFPQMKAVRLGGTGPAAPCSIPTPPTPRPPTTPPAFPHPTPTIFPPGQLWQVV